MVMNDDELFSHFTLYRGVWIATTPHQSKKITREDATKLLKKGGLMVRNTYDFDCEEETEFWYVVKDAPFVFEDLSAKQKRFVRKALERCEVRQMDPKIVLDDAWMVYEAAFENYKNADNKKNEKEFKNEMTNASGCLWAAFCKKTGTMVGWMLTSAYSDFAEIKMAKYHPSYSYVRPSTVLHNQVLYCYLNTLNLRYLSSGTRNLNHKTNVQEYKISKWHFRKAYCRLKVYYSPKIGGIVQMIYPFRRLLRCFDSVTFFHRVNGLLKMEEIARTFD